MGWFELWERGQCCQLEDLSERLSMFGKVWFFQSHVKRSGGFNGGGGGAFQMQKKVILTKKERIFEKKG